MAADPYELIANDSKTTITASGGITLGYGPGPGLANANFWNRIGSLFSCYRPSVGLLSVFSAKDLHQPLHLKKLRALWHPNHVAASYSASGLAISENRYASKSGLHSRLCITNTRKTPQSIVLCFHGTVEQQPFFDYPRTDAPPNVRCEIDPKRREVTLTQPHPHHGLPQVVNSIQRVWLELPGASKQPLASCGFGQNEGDLRTLWHDHGALASLRMRLGQVGGRYSGSREASSRIGEQGSPLPIQFSHPHPLYYMTVALELSPGETREVILRTDFHTDDEAGDLRTKSEQERRYPKPDVAIKREAAAWRKYLRREVPQMDCDDAALVRYWYYVWYVLRSNRTAGGRHIKHAFTAPSKYMYWGPWIWDGYFHVLGEMWLQDKSIAEDTIRSILDMQFPNGYIPVCSGANYRMCFHEDVPGYKNPQGGGYASYVESELAGYKELKHPLEAEVAISGGTGGSPVNSGDAGVAPTKFIHNEKTQTPLITKAAYLVFEMVRKRSRDAGYTFKDEVWPKLLAFDEWLSRRRTDKQGRFILWHGDESGWDSATRHYPVPAKPFDVQLHLASHRYYLMDRDEDDPVFKKYWKAVKTYWHKQDRWFYDIGASGDGQKSTGHRKQIAPSALFALSWRLKPRQQESLIAALENDVVFNASYPIPTLAKCDPDYAPHGWGWNGPVWLQVNYFTMVGLIQSCHYDAANALWEKTKRLIIRDGKPNSYELYDPETGTGMGCPDYSWQVMINNLIIEHFAGVSDSGLMPSLPKKMKYLELSNLPQSLHKITFARSGKELKINASYNLKQSKKVKPFRGVGILPRVNVSRMEDVKSIKGNGVALRRYGMPSDGGDKLWVLPKGTRPSKEWEIIITCR